MQLRNSLNRSDTICAISSPSGMGAIALIRISGENAINTLEKVFFPSKEDGKKSFASHTVHYGKFVAGDEVVDSLLMTVFASPSFLYRRRHGRIQLSRVLVYSKADHGDSAEFGIAFGKPG